MTSRHPRDAVITGIGLVSPLAEGAGEHVRLLTGNERPAPLLDTGSFAPFPVHPLVEIDLNRQIPKRGDQRQMEAWQRYGTYAAGLALEDSGLAGNLEVLNHTGLIVAAGGGERDPEVDVAVLDGIKAADNPGAFINEQLMNGLRPTLFLAQLSNLLAGNISIVHHVTGSSRSFMGEETAGAMSLQTAMRQVKAGQGDVFLVGGSYNGPRPDMLLVFAFGNYLWTGTEVPPVWQRTDQPGGMICASMGAFLVIEAREHAEKRGGRIYARLDDVMAERGPRDENAEIEQRAAPQFTRLAEIAGEGPVGILSGASGAKQALQVERRMLEAFGKDREIYVRGCATMIGHGIEAQMPACVGLAAAALREQKFFMPFDDQGFEQPAREMPKTIGVTGWGHWRGEALAIVSADD